MTLRPSDPSWSERSRRTRHRLTLSGNRPTDRVAGSLRTACRRDPPLPPNLIRAGQRPGAGPTPLARDTLVAPFERIPVAPQRAQPARRGTAGKLALETTSLLRLRRGRVAEFEMCLAGCTESGTNCGSWVGSA